MTLNKTASRAGCVSLQMDGKRKSLDRVELSKGGRKTDKQQTQILYPRKEDTDIRDKQCIGITRSGDKPGFIGLNLTRFGQKTIAHKKLIPL